ncbi:MAG: AzlC family ABC transporter permease, partial [Methanosphaera sp.]|nr:AzlC family ABC transporter permease [Methanosphaera sp.]
AIPITMGYIPMGIGYAALAIKAGLSPIQTVSFSVLVYAGAGEIIAVTMLASNATIIAIILTNLVVNLRYMVMNTCVYNKATKTSLLLNVLSAHLVTDESFALFSLMEESSIWFYIGLALISWLSWIFGAIIGVLVLDLLPIVVTNSFNISLYALFVAILVPSIKENKKIGLLVAITAIINVVLQFVIGNWSLIVSTLVGALIGMEIIDDDYLLNDNDGVEC